MGLGERFWSKVDQSGECWIWTAALHRTGYGFFWWDGKQRYAHRVSFEAVNGPIPKGMFLDHLCHTADPTCAMGWGCMHRRCVNPAHLEVVTSAENTRRGRDQYGPLVGRTHCKNGHEFTPENTHLTMRKDREPFRRCRRCDADRRMARYYRATGGLTDTVAP